MSEPETMPEGDISVFSERRERVFDSLGDGAMVIPAAPMALQGGTSELPYRPGSELFYLTGFAEPDALLVLRGFASEDRAVLFCRPRDAHAEMWWGPRMGPDRAKEALGLDAAFPIGRVAEDLPGLLGGAGLLHFRLGVEPDVERAVVTALRVARRKGSSRGTGPRGVLDPGGILDDLRIVKDPIEIGAIRRAVDLTVQGFEAALGTLAPGRGEWEVEAELEASFRRGGAFGPAFATIVGSGPNACVLHHTRNDRRMAADELVLLDGGAELGMYSGDLSRTAPVSGTFSPLQREVYEIVDSARRAAIAGIRPGLNVEELHERALEVIVTGLRDLGVLTESEDEITEERLFAPYFPHRTSHWLGLDTHDVGDYERDGDPRRLEPGMVLTVEPGLYFPGSLTDGPLAGIGVRVEDDVLVTGSGAEVLSADLPTRPEEVEALVRGDA